MSRLLPREQIIVAYKKGYRVSENGETVIGATGKPLLAYAYKGYLFFNMKHKQIAYKIPVHRLAAFQKYGEALFNAACVRHKNGVSLDNSQENLLIGSHRENAMDRKKEDRVKHALIASQKVMRTDWDQIDKERKLGKSYNELRDLFGVSTSTLSYRYSKTAKRRKYNRQL